MSGEAASRPARRPIRLVRQGYADPPALDTAVSHALLRAVAEGRWPETVRLHRPGAVVAFGPRDRLAPGYRRAVAAAEAHGFAAVERLAGGRAAVFHEGTIAFSWVRPVVDARDGIRARFEEVAGLMVAALRSLGVDARVGEIPGEYCPGEHSVNAGGRVKLVGIGQRVIRGAAHVGGVVVVDGADRVRDVLGPVYRALDLPLRIETVGAVRDEAPATRWRSVADAVEGQLVARHDVGEATLDEPILRCARDLIDRHSASSAR